MSNVGDRVRRSIEQHRLMAPGELVVVGVSGGPDSLCLLHVLRSLEDYGLDLHVAHLHHGLRGAEADEDAEAVRSLAAEWNLPCTVDQVIVQDLAREHKLAIEEAARRARYRFLGRVAHTIGARCITVGHNADDQAETVLMHWIRGSGLAGLRGMLPMTPLSDYRLSSPPNSAAADPALRLVRPLLEVSRSEIVAYCALHGLEPRFDRSNLDTTYFRNWLRHEVLPMLASHNPSVREVIRRSARVLSDDYDLLRSLLFEAWLRVVRDETRERIVVDLEAWLALPTSSQRSMIREAVYRLRRTLRDVSFLHVENALLVARDGTTGDQSTLPQGLVLTVGYGEFTIESSHADPVLPDWPLLAADGDPVPVNPCGVTPLPDSAWCLEVEAMSCHDLPGDWEVNRHPWRAFVDATAVGGRLSLRSRKAGDRFCPLGMGGRTVKLSDFLTNQKVRRVVRDRLPLLVGEMGIVWVCGQRVDERARIRDSTETALVVRFAGQRAG